MIKINETKRRLITFSKATLFAIGALVSVFSFGMTNLYSQQTTSAQYYSPQANQSPLKNSAVFQQEIARMEITVTRAGKQTLSLTQVPRVQKDDVLKLRLLDEAVNGIKIDQTQWDWTMLVAFINPLHRMIDTVETKGGTGTVSQEIQFRKQGWYKEYTFVVPYDSQPVFFLYPKPKYRSQLVKVVNSKYEEIRKLGEKTIELANAYSKINTFVNEMQSVLNRNAQIYGYNTNNGSSAYNPYGSTYTNPYNVYNPYGTTTQNNTDPKNAPVFGLPPVQAMNQLVEGLAKSFNIQLPNCWNNGMNASPYGGSSGYNPYSSTYNSGYSGYGGTMYGGYGNYGQNYATMDFISRAQCVAKNVNLEDFDISVTRMWQQGGVFLAAELQRKYPQIAYWINIAAVAIDFIVKIFQKSPLRIVPTVIQSNDPQGGFNNNSLVGGYSTQYSYGYTGSSPNPNNNQNSAQAAPVKISLFADSQPKEGDFTTAYPIVVHKWQANPDPEVISLYPPVLAESCLHAGTNILKSLDLTNQWSEDVYSRNFRLVISSTNGFKKEFPLRKNIGLAAWELNITPEEMNQIPKINMALESEIVGTRGFNEIRSPKFNLPISLGGTYEITPESQKAFSVGGKRVVTLKNTVGSCRCLQQVIYKPSFGGQFVFENPTDQKSPNALMYSADGSEVSFEIDTTNFQPGSGTLEVKSYGSEAQQTSLQAGQQSPNSLPLKLYPAPPFISDVKVGRGDREILMTGERLDQIQTVYINGKKAKVVGGAPSSQPTATTQTVNQPIATTTWNQTPNQSAASVNQPGANTSVGSTAVAGLNQYQSIDSNQRVAVFEDSNTRINSKTITLELILDDNRSLNYPNQYMVGISRPMIQASNQNEIEGIFLNQTSADVRTEQGKDNLGIPKVKQIDLAGYPVVPIDRSALTVAVQNILTDYSFRIENLSVETRIENASTNPNELPDVKFDVLDTNNLRLNFILNKTVNKILSGRRLQFRIVDRERGSSDWYSIKQTFIRIPQIDSVVCTNEMTNQCELKGSGLDYIGQVSVDGGRTWTGEQFMVQPTADGKTMMRIPLLINQKFLQIKLRDYPNTEGFEVSNFRFSNTVRKNVKSIVR